MTRKELIQAVHEQVELISAQDVNTVIQKTFDVIKESLSEGDDVTVYGFGKFHVQTLPAGEARNPKTGEIVKVDERKKVRFKPSNTIL